MKTFNKKNILKTIKRIAAVTLVSAISMGITACSMSSTANGDILTQKAISLKRIPITVLVKHAFTINSFEKEIEEKFPEVDIIQVANYSEDMGKNEYEARLKNDDLTDIVMTWPFDVGQQYLEDRLIDLSSMEFTNRYNISMLQKTSLNGKLFYLPGPAQVRGILYNKTLFKENNWKVPTDYVGFLELCKTIEKTGIRSIQLPMKNAEVLDTAFIGYCYGDCFSTPEDNQWLLNYNAGKGSFGDQFDGALDTFQEMIDAGIWKKEDLGITYSDREKMFFTRQCAMVEDSVLMARLGYSRTGTTDEYGLMPFFNPGENNDWARLYMVCYIGLNKHLTEPANKEKMDLIMQIMDYISTSEGQEALASDTGAMYSSLNGVGAPNVPEIKDLLPALEQGRYAIFPESKNVQNAFRESLANMVNGTMTKEEVIKYIDNQNTAPVSQKAEKVLGTATETFSLIETGNFVTDAMREKSGCDIALFLDNGKDGKGNSKGITAKIYKDDITNKDIRRILPDLAHGETGTMWEITMSGEDLMKTLEYSIVVDNNITGWFYYFSGLRVSYAPSAAQGSRIHKITDSLGNEIDPNKIYTIAVMDETVPEEYIKSYEKTDILISDILTEKIVQSQTISPSKDGRFIVIQ